MMNLAVAMMKLTAQIVMIKFIFVKIMQARSLSVKNVYSLI